MAVASKVSGENYRRIFPEYDPVFAVRLEIFSEINFPCGITGFHMTSLNFKLQNY